MDRDTSLKNQWAAPRRRTTWYWKNSHAGRLRFGAPTFHWPPCARPFFAVEDELAHARAQATVRLTARHKRDADTLHPEDRDLDLYELKVTVEQTLPRVFRGGFVLTLWSIFDVVTTRMAEYAALQRGDPIAPSQWKQEKGETFLDVLERVYAKKLGIAAFPDPEERGGLDRLRKIRTVLIHHNGSVAALEKLNQLGGPQDYAALGLDRHSGSHEEFVIPNADFLNRNFALVETHLSSLSERAYTAAHPTALEDR